MNNCIATCLAISAICCSTPRVFGQQPDAREEFRSTVEDPGFKALRDKIRAKQTEMRHRTVAVDEVVYVPVVQRYGHHGRKRRVVYVPRRMRRYRNVAEAVQPPSLDWSQVDESDRAYGRAVANIGPLKTVTGARMSKVSEIANSTLTGLKSAPEFDEVRAISQNSNFDDRIAGTQEIYSIRIEVSPDNEAELLVRVAVAARDAFGRRIEESDELDRLANSKAEFVKTRLEK